MRAAHCHATQSVRRNNTIPAHTRQNVSYSPGESKFIIMRPIITIDASGHLVSTIEDADTGTSAVNVGTRFEFEKPYETPWGEVPVGVVATVTEVHEATGELYLEVRDVIPALVLWSNLLIMLPFMSDDLANCLRLLC